VKAAIMQPYLFPYIGYFQLIKAVDTFVFYDDVNFIKQGWINRNQILNNGRAQFFVVPLKGQSSKKKINELGIDSQSNWRKKIIKAISHNYCKAPYFNIVFPIIQEVIYDDYENIAELSKSSIALTSSFLGLSTSIIESSTIFKNNTLGRQERVINICNKIGAETYINPIGGEALYSKADFMEKSIKLKFIQMDFSTAKELEDNFYPQLSIIHLMMHFSVSEINYFLDNYELV
jgi:hypothetical protein